MKKKTVRDRYFSEDQPSNNFDFVEVLVGDIGALDQYIYNSPQVQQILGSSFQINLPTGSKLTAQKKQKRLLKKIMQAATKTLTDRQFQIFILRFVFNLTQEEVASRLTREHLGRPKLRGKHKKIVGSKPLSQEYVVQCLQTIIKKIQKELRLKRTHKPPTK